VKRNESYFKVNAKVRKNRKSFTLMKRHALCMTPKRFLDKNWRELFQWHWISAYSFEHLTYSRNTRWINLIKETNVLFFNLTLCKLTVCNKVEFPLSRTLPKSNCFLYDTEIKTLKNARLIDKENFEHLQLIIYSHCHRFYSMW
jgi:hypothetical protein